MSKQESWVEGLDFKIQGRDCVFPEIGIRENPDYGKTRKGPYCNFGDLQLKFRLVFGKVVQYGYVIHKSEILLSHGVRPQSRRFGCKPASQLCISFCN